MFGSADMVVQPDDQIVAIAGDVTGEGGFGMDTDESHSVRGV